MPPKASAQSAGTGPFSVRMKAFFVNNKRDLFFGFIAAFALGSVVRMELMKKGVIGRPRQEDVRPKVSREFGKSKREDH